MKKAKIVLIDMDNTTFDFDGYPAFEGRELFDPPEMYAPKFFLELKPVDGALQGVRSLINTGYDVWICTQPVAHSPHSYMEKAQAVGMWFPELIGKIIMTQDKGMIDADYLIDDNRRWENDFKGRFVHFKYNRKGTGGLSHHQMWNYITAFFEAEKNGQEVENHEF